MDDALARVDAGLDLAFATVLVATGRPSARRASSRSGPSTGASRSAGRGSPRRPGERARTPRPSSCSSSTPSMCSAAVASSSRPTRSTSGRGPRSRASRRSSRGSTASTCSSATGENRDSAWYSVVDDEWPTVRAALRSTSRPGLRPLRRQTRLYRHAMATRVAFRTCPLCEATCGLRLEIEDGHVRRIRGDDEDPFSRGFICPKGSTLGTLHDDPDRLRRPLVRRDGALSRSAGRRRSPRSSVGSRLSSPSRAATPSPSTSATRTPTTSPTRSRSGRSSRRSGRRTSTRPRTVDQMPKHVACGLVFGHPLAIPVPDIDRTDLLLLLGANPLESNGSLATAPDWPGRLEAIRRRGGRVVVVDPRRTRTAEHADLHVPDPPRHRRRPARGNRARPVRRRSRGSGPLADTVSGHRRRRGCGGRLHAGARGVAHRRAGRRPLRRWPATWPPPRRPSSTGASAPTRPPTAPSPRGSSTSSTSSPGTSTARVARCSPTRPTSSRSARRGLPHRPLDEPRTRPARGARRAARGDARRRDGDAGRGPGSGAR